MKEIDPEKTSLEELKSRSRPERPLLQVCRLIIACQYAILGFIITMMMFSGQFRSLKKIRTDTTANKFNSLTHPLAKLEPIRKVSSVTKITNTKTFEKDDDLSFLEKIQSNPFRLSTSGIMQQMRSAKIPSLRNRVKRFACWHSCFGQFRRKAFRALYPKPNPATPVPLTPSPESNTTTVTEEPENQNKQDEYKDVKRDAMKDGGEAPDSPPLPANNDLSEGDVNGTFLKQNTTDFFKLKTKERELAKLNNDVSTPSTTDQPHSKENLEGNENGTEKKVASKGESGHRGNTVIVKSVEISESEDGDGYEESESSNGNESEISVSEEAIEDKGDGIDKKDMEAEKKDKKA